MNLQPRIKRETIFSSCRQYRYTLWREWGELPLGFHEDPHVQYLPGKPDQYVQFIGLNPSTADETKDDNTIRLCIGYAKRWGFGAMCMTNIFAWRDTDPEAMKRVPSPIGEGVNGNENDYWLCAISHHAGLIVAAWGTDGAHLGRGEQVHTMIQNLHCLGTNNDGTPMHPLYKSKNLLPVPYRKTNQITKH